MDKLKEIREKLDEWFNKAKKSPVFISRKNEKFVLIKEELLFTYFQSGIKSLQVFVSARL